MHRFSKSLIAVMMVSAFAACTADVEDPGEAPDVDVDVQGGRAPDVDVDPVDVDVSRDTQTIVTPDIDVNTTEP